MYANDTVVLVNSAESLQRMLNNLHTYCKKWKLKVNESKTKVIIFRKRKPCRKHSFLYNNQILEVVDSFKYLGTVLKFNGNVDLEDVKIKATKAMFSLLSKGRRLHLPVNIQLGLNIFYFQIKRKWDWTR